MRSMCFYGLTSPADGPSRYVHCLQHVFRVYQQMKPTPPLVVNTMGWNEGVCVEQGTVHYNFNRRTSLSLLITNFDSLKIILDQA